MANIDLSESDSFDGQSILPALTGKATHVYGPEVSIGVEAAGQAALLRGSIKLRVTTHLMETVFGAYTTFIKTLVKQPTSRVKIMNC
ncbi:MAG: hypothetical protein ACI9FR_000094 [Cryomorphaceae bacterium]|jgi:hypothetical protein